MIAGVPTVNFIATLTAPVATILYLNVMGLVKRDWSWKVHGLATIFVLGLIFVLNAALIMKLIPLRQSS